MASTAKFKPYRIQSSQLNSLPKVEGQFIVIEDTQEIYFDKSSTERILIGKAIDTTAFTKSSIIPNDAGEIKTKYRLAQKGYTNGATWYYSICKFPVNNDGNYASAIISGRIGGWVANNLSSITALAWNRGGAGIALLDIAGTATSMSSIWNIADLVIYTDSNNIASLFVKCKGYFTFDLDLELFQGAATILYNGNYSTTTPEGTLSTQASTSTKRMEFVNGKLYIAGTEMVSTNGTQALTNKTYNGYTLAAAAAKNVDTSISDESTSANLPTSAAVAAFVEGKGYKTTDNNTTYTLTQDANNGHKITLTPSSGTPTTITIPDNNSITGVKGDNESSYRTGNVNITKGNIGLGNVENKSSATIRGEITSANVTTALGYTPLNNALKGANNGVAELGADGKVPSAQLPSYVDDVLEYNGQSNFPATGETGKIYVDTSTNKTYRWSGSTYTEISASLALGETSSTAYRGDRGKIAYDHSQSTHARTDATKTEASATNGNIKINGTETTVYTHPTTTATAAAAVKVGKDAAGHVVLGTALTKSDVGLENVGNFKAVSTAASQGLTDTEKSNARANIGAGTSSLTLGTSSSTAYRGDYGNAAYTHAVTNKGTAFTSGLYKITTNAEGHVIAATAVTKTDITALGIPAQDTVLEWIQG